MCHRGSTASITPILQSSMPDTQRAFLLGELLKNVSRSFYLTLRVLPAGLREPIGLAYLLARAADTIADTSVIPPEHRVELLLSLRAQVNGVADQSRLARIESDVAGQQADSHEHALLASIKPMLALLDALDDGDRAAVRHIVTTLTKGMEFDLRTFPDERSGRLAALDTADELDHYTYLVAGCVGEFWTTITHAHRPEVQHWDLARMSQRGVRFGKALQLTNILRDCGKDLRIGRCYVPAELLEPLGLRAEDLLQPGASRDAKPLLFDLVRRTLDHYREAADYTLAIPRRCVRLRLACLWPILIGLETLLLLVRNVAWLDPARASKISRNDVYRLTALSLPVAGSNSVVRGWIGRLIARVEAQMH
jgi:farnesyl-diphosphate farnesyltransferase